MTNPHRHLLAALAVSTALAVAVCLLYVSSRSGPGPRDPAWTGATMGTTYSIRLAGSALTRSQLVDLRAEVDRALAEVNRQMSHYDPDSELSRFNRSRSTAPFAVSAPFASVVRFAVELHRRSGGLFDPTLGPLINLWGFGPAGRIENPPTPEQVRSTLRTVGGRHLSVPSDTEIGKDIPELQLNLSAVAKGYGVDEAARVIRARGLANVFVEIGGEVATFGHNAVGGKWRVGVETPDPRAIPGESLEAVLELSDLAVATSGDYRNFFEDAQGRRYAHILNPHTGYPAKHNLASVSVVASSCLVADGLATTLFVMGAEEGMEWLKGQPGAEALFIVRHPDGTFAQLASPGFEKLTGYRVPPE